MNRITLGVFLVAASFGLGLGGGSKFFELEHQKHIDAIKAFAVTSHCVDLGPPLPGKPLTDHVSGWYQCDGALVIISK